MMKSQFLLIILLLGMLGCAPTQKVDIIPFVERGDFIEPAAPSTGNHLSSGSAEAVESGIQTEEVIQITKDQSEPMPPLAPVKPSPDVTQIQPAGVVDLRELEVGNTDLDEERLQEMPNPQLARPNTALADMAKQELATRLEIDIEAVALVSSVVVESPDSKIKCQANNGGRRRPKVTFIYQITLEAAGKEYIYYAEPGGTLSLCKER